ncbi:MAG TPA: ABC transporter permease [Clostridiales bacterium]|nr:MAG: hypothetical protein A2Y22_02650 [Clostridiales bacterium GWD2_32_59]HAN08983.1 ABC transporter permease [Clostridiales bacterium]
MVRVIKAEILMLMGELKQYKFNYIFYNISMIIIYIGVLISFNSEKGSGTVVLLYGLITWQLCTSALTYISSVVEEEAMIGTLEQMFMTRTNIIYIYGAKIIVNVTFNFIKALISFLIVILLFGLWNDFIHIGLENILIMLIIIFTVFCFYILGLMFGGFALFYKRIQAFLGIITYVLLFFTNITSPVNELPVYLKGMSYMIPMTWATKNIENIVANNILWNDVIILILISVLYSIIGVLVFKYYIEKAKVKGNLGHY